MQKIGRKCIYELKNRSLEEKKMRCVGETWDYFLGKNSENSYKKKSD